MYIPTATILSLLLFSHPVHSKIRTIHVDEKGTVTQVEDPTGHGTLVKKSDTTSKQVEKRQVEELVFLGLSGAVTGILVGSAVAAISQAWDAGREVFTTMTTFRMTQVMSKRPNGMRAFPAAVCYGKRWDAKYPNMVAGLQSKEIKTGRIVKLHTTYDCMYLRSPNSFWTREAGGYINLAFSFDDKVCTFNKDTSDLDCKDEHLRYRSCQCHNTATQATAGGPKLCDLKLGTVQKNGDKWCNLLLSDYTDDECNKEMGDNVDKHWEASCKDTPSEFILSTKPCTEKDCPAGLE